MVYSWNCDRKTVAFCELRGQFRGCCQDVNACYRRRRAFFLSESTFSNCQFCRIQFVDTSPLSFWQLAFVPTLGLSSSYFSNGKLIDEGWNSFWSFLYQMTTRRVKVGLVLDFCTLLFWTKKKLLRSEQCSIFLFATDKTQDLLMTYIFCKKSYWIASCVIDPIFP